MMETKLKVKMILKIKLEKDENIKIKNRIINL